MPLGQSYSIQGRVGWSDPGISLSYRWPVDVVQRERDRPV